MSNARTYYRIIRSILFSAIIAVGVLYVALYVVLSIPPVQKYIKGIAEKELSSLLGSKLEIGSLNILPFNEARLKEVVLFTPEGEKCLSVGTLGAGINLWRLISEKQIEITYAEILDLDGRVWRKSPESPLNIQFIIDAVSPKDKNKPPTKFDLKIHNIVIRRSSLSFDKLWIPKESHPFTKFDSSHIKITDLRADVTLPILRNDDFLIDLRRLSFKESSGLDVSKVSLKTHITATSLSVTNLMINIGESRLFTSDFTLHYPSFKEISKALDQGISFSLIGENLLPADFSPFYSQLKNLPGLYYLDLGIAATSDKLDISNLIIRDNRSGLNVETTVVAENYLTPQKIFISSDQLRLQLPQIVMSSLMEIIPSIPDKTKEIIGRLGGMDLTAKGNFSNFTKHTAIDCDLSSQIGEIKIEAKGEIDKKLIRVDNYNLEIKDFDLGTIFNVDQVGFLSMNSSGNISITGKELEGKAETFVDHLDLRGHRISNIDIYGEKIRDNIDFDISVDNYSANLNIKGGAFLDSKRPSLSLQGQIHSLKSGSFGLLPKFGDSDLSGLIDLDVSGNSPDNLLGNIDLSNIIFKPGKDSGFKELRLNDLNVTIESLNQESENESNSVTGLNRKASITSDFLIGEISGRFTVAEIKNCVRGLVTEALPGFISYKENKKRVSSEWADINLSFLPDTEIYDFLKLPVKPLTPVSLQGNLDIENEKLNLNLSAPYLLKGADKLITDTELKIEGSDNNGVTLILGSTFPVKNDRLNLSSDLSFYNGNAEIGLNWQSKNDPTANGHIELDGFLKKKEITKEIEAGLHVRPSQFHLGEADWNISESKIDYLSSRLTIKGLRIWHGDQYVDINGVASSLADETINIAMRDIDLGYIFGILNINYVTFGGIATGEISASEVFSKNPIAQTKRLSIKDFSYNDARLGEAEIFSRWNHDEKEVEISAEISDNGERRAQVSGGVFVTRDSLDFSMRADKVNVEFLKPFMSAFTSDVGGIASGDIRLFGNFKDIDLTGRAFADSIYMKVDYTNVYYHGSDSVILDPGKIIIPSFRLKDKYGQSAIFSGVVRHSYFHNPEFEFKLNNATSLLCYDTDATINPDWYGRIFASGNGSLWGRPGIVALMMDMTTDSNSDFTFVLNETQTAVDYTFLTFSDKKKQKAVEAMEVEETFEEKFRKKNEEQATKPTVFTMDLRASVTPAARMNLVMDPKTGDRIMAHGYGPLQISYDTESEEMKMYGKYTLSEGDYKFNLQDLILRDFIIKEGSNISFNGDPLRALLDVSAAYRVNTNLSDLDKSFSSDKDLNRTNVPVDAILNVRGDLESPEITFDIELPTLTSDVARKVRSIISTDDMMNRQIIYLLALNRFYTPEYMGGSSNGGGELASVASSTISSQLSNIVGSLTDKVTFMPSIRSDKGDFSDMEVDLTLSSRLLNNRLLINGNFGYRDKNTSQTTFVGDFDLEYLLNKNGNLRLKAYNHFNDQYYYLKSALTTQGIGILYRKEFDNPFTFLRRKKKSKADKEKKEEEDSSQIPGDNKSEESVGIREETDNLVNQNLKNE